MDRAFDTHGVTTEMLLLGGRSLEDVLYCARASTELEVEVEEETAVLSTRPTVPVFEGEPWR